MVEAYTDLNIGCWVEIENRLGELEKHRGWIQEIEMNKKGDPFCFVIHYGTKKKRMVPRFENGLLISSLRGRKIFRVLVDAEYEWFRRIPNNRADR